MTPFLFDVRSQLRHQVRRVAFHSKNCIFRYFLFLQCESVLVRVFDFAAHNERFAHTVLLPAASCEWRALHRFAPLAIRRVTRCACVI